MAWGDIPWKCNFCASGSLWASNYLMLKNSWDLSSMNLLFIYLFTHSYFWLPQKSCGKGVSYLIVLKNIPTHQLIIWSGSSMLFFHASKKKLTILHMLLCLYRMPIHLSSRLKSHPIYLLSCGSCFISLNTLPLYPPPMFFHMIFNMKKLDSPHKVSELDSHTALKMWFFVLFSPWSLKLAP